MASNPKKNKAAAKKEPISKKRGRPKKKPVENKEIAIPEKKKVVKRDYYFAVGRRKSAVARVRYYKKSDTKEIIINKLKVENYFPPKVLQRIVLMPFEVIGTVDGRISIKVRGGGKKGQAEAISLGISRVLEKFNPELRSQLKKAGLLRRDSRVKERKKYGLKRARRAPQWQKR